MLITPLAVPRRKKGNSGERRRRSDWSKRGSGIRFIEPRPTGTTAACVISGPSVPNPMPTEEGIGGGRAGASMLCRNPAGRPETDPDRASVDPVIVRHIEEMGYLRENQNGMIAQIRSCSSNFREVSIFSISGWIPVLFFINGLPKNISKKDVFFLG